MISPNFKLFQILLFTLPYVPNFFLSSFLINQITQFKFLLKITNSQQHTILIMMINLWSISILFLFLFFYQTKDGFSFVEEKTTSRFMQEAWNSCEFEECRNGESTLFPSCKRTHTLSTLILFIYLLF